MRAASYARFSSDMQNPRSIPNQHALNREHAERQGWTVVAEFSDAEKSGAFMVNRPSLQDLMKAAEGGCFDVVVVESMDRLSRGFSDSARIFELLTHWGVKIITLADGEMDKVRVMVKGLVGSLQLDNLAQKVRRGHIGRVKEGHVPGGRCYGYDMVKGEPGVRTIDEGQKEIIRRIFRDYVAGITPTQIVRALNAEGIPSPRGKRWRTTMITGSKTRANGILQQGLYIGRIVYGRRPQPKDPNTGRKVGRASPEAAWKIGENPKLAIVDRETWDAAQALRQSRASPHPRYHRRPKHLLSGLLTCGICGSSVTVKTWQHGKPYLACSGHKERGGCRNNRMVPGPGIEHRVLAGLRDKLLVPENIVLAVRAYREERARLAAERARMRDSTERELAEVRRQKANVRDAIKLGGELRSLVADLADLEQREKALEVKLPTAAPDIVTLHPQAEQRYRQIVEDLGKALAASEPARARAMALVRSLITGIVVVPTAPRKPVDLRITGNLLALLVEEGELRRDVASQAAPVAITV